MKRFSIFFLSFIILFGTSVAFAGFYGEDFEDGELTAPWNYGGLDWQIIPFQGSMVFNMTEGIRPSEGDVVISEVGSYFDEYVYHFEADVYIPSATALILGIVLIWDDISDPTIGYRTDLKFHPLFQNIWVSSVKNDGTEIGSEILLENVDFNQWLNLSITYHDDHISVGINGNETDLFFGLYQKPTSTVQSYCSVHGHDPIINDPDLGINWYTDNIKAYTSMGGSSNDILDSVIDAVDQWIESGELVGSVGGQLTAFENILNNAQTQLDKGNINATCNLLRNADNFSDGQSPPPDKVEGDAIQDLQEMISIIRTDLGCE